MGIRGELYSSRFACDGRTYFFNVKENRNGDVFLSIVESKPSEGESFDRRSIVIFGEHMEGFLKSFQSALKYIDTTGTKPGSGSSAPRRSEERPRNERSSGYREASAPPRDPKAKRLVLRPASDRPRGEAPARPRNPVRKSEAGAQRYDSAEPKSLKRIVVKRAKKADSPD